MRVMVETLARDQLPPPSTTLLSSRVTSVCCLCFTRRRTFKHPEGKFACVGSRDLVSNFCRSSLKYYPSVSEAHRATLIPVRQSDTRAGIPNRGDEDEEDEPPEGKHAKVKRRSVLSGSIRSRNSSFFLMLENSKKNLKHLESSNVNVLK